MEEEEEEEEEGQRESPDSIIPSSTADVLTNQGMGDKSG
jgi:hypothetical protein